MGQWFSRKKTAIVQSLVPKQIRTLQKQIHNYETNMQELGPGNNNIRNLYAAQKENLQQKLETQKKQSLGYRTLKTLGLRPLSGGYTRKRKRFH